LTGCRARPGPKMGQITQVQRSNERTTPIPMQRKREGASAVEEPSSDAYSQCCYSYKIYRRGIRQALGLVE